MPLGLNLLQSAVKNPLVRQFLRQKGFEDDILDGLLANTRVGQPADTPFAMDLAPMALRLIGTGLLNFQVAGTNRDFVWPWFLSRQLNPEDHGFCARGHNFLYLNQHFRNWTGIGRFADPNEAVVDPAGLLTPRRFGYSVDVWAKSPEGVWHFPSRTPHDELKKLQQSLVENLPIVETKLELDEEHQLVMMAFVQGFEDVPLATLQAKVEGPNAAEWEVTVSVRPVNPEGMSLVKELQFENNAWWSAKEPFAVFLETPFLSGASPFLEGDVAWHLQRGRVDFPLKVKCRTGLATAFSSFKEKVTVFAPIEPVTADEDSLKKLRELDQDAVFGQVVADWRQEKQNLPQFQHTDKNIQNLYEACQSWMLLFYDRDPLTDKDQITPGPMTYHHFWFRDAAYLVSTLDRIGRHDLAERILYTYPHRQQEDGFFISQDGEWDANGQAMWTLFLHYRLTKNTKFLREVYPSMARGARWIGKKRKKGARDAEGVAKGLLPAGISAEHLGATDYYYWDDFWCLRGLLDAAEAATILGKTEDAKEFADEAEAFRADIETSLEKVATRLGEPLLPSGPLTRINSGAIGSLCASYPTEVLEANDHRLLNTVRAVREDSFFRGGFFQHIYHSGTNIYLSLQVAQCELRAGSTRHQHIFRNVVNLATTTWTYPEAVHPITGGGCMGDGHHGWAAAEVVNYVHSCFVLEEDGGLGFLKGVDPDWFVEGEELFLGPLPTIYGAVKVSARKKAGELVMSLEAEWSEAPLGLRVYSPSDPGHFVDYTEADRNFTQAF